MKTDHTLLAVFPYVDEFLSCLKTLKEEGYAIANAFSPVRLPEMQDLLTPKPSLTRTFTLIGGIIGASRSGRSGSLCPSQLQAHRVGQTYSCLGTLGGCSFRGYHPGCFPVRLCVLGFQGGAASALCRSRL